MCLVLGCSEVLASTADRRKHLVSVHKFPKRFCFERAPTQQRSESKPKPSVKKEGARQRKCSFFFGDRRGCKFGDSCVFRHELREQGAAEEMAVTVYGSSSEAALDGAPASGDGDDMDLDTVTAGLAVMRVAVPSKISFGRRGRPERRRPTAGAADLR